MGGGPIEVFFPMKRGGAGMGRKSFRSMISPFCSPHPVINDQFLILVNFEGLFLRAPSEIPQELCKLVITISQGIDRYKVPVVGINGKLNETIEVSALWSIPSPHYVDIWST